MERLGRLAHDAAALRDHTIDGVFDRQHMRLHLLEVTAHRVPALFAGLEQLLALDDDVHRAADVQVVRFFDGVFYALDQLVDGLLELVDALLRIFDDRVDFLLDVIDVLFDLVLGLVEQLDRRLAHALPLVDALGDRGRDIRANLRHGALYAAGKVTRCVKRPLPRGGNLAHFGLDLLPNRPQLAPRQPRQLALQLFDFLQLGARVVLLRHRILHRLAKLICRRSWRVKLVRRLADFAHRVERDAAQLAGRALDLRDDAAGRVDRLLGDRAGRHRDDLRQLLCRLLRRGCDFVCPSVDRAPNFGGTLLGLVDDADHIFACRRNRFLGGGLGGFQVARKCACQTIDGNRQATDQPLDRIKALLSLGHCGHRRFLRIGGPALGQLKVSLRRRLRCFFCCGNRLLRVLKRRRTAGRQNVEASAHLADDLFDSGLDVRKGRHRHLDEVPEPRLNVGQRCLRLFDERPDDALHRRLHLVDGV